MKEKLKTIIGWFVFIFLIIGVVSAFSGDDNYKSKLSSYPLELESRFNLENKEDEKNNRIDEGKEYNYGNIYYNFDEHDYDVNRYQNLGGTYTVEACNTRTGSCYDLNADIDEGVVERIYFPNGGHLDLDGAELDEDGYTTGESYTESEGYDGNEWEVNCYDCED